MNRKREIFYLVFVLGICYLLGVAAFFAGGETQKFIFGILQKGFTAFPVLGAFIVRAATKEKITFHLSLKVWKKPCMWLFCTFGIGLLIAAGAVLYFLIFKDTYSGVFDLPALLPAAGSMAVAKTITSPIKFIFITILGSAVFIPLQLFELGEEVGWRGYLLPKQIERYGVRKGVLLNGFFWGIAHLPLIYFGFNYSLENPAAPYSNMVLMMLVCFSFGTICSYVTIKTGNCMYSAIVHGMINILGEIPVFLSVSEKNGLLGPNPSGLIGMLAVIICAVIILIRLPKVENKLSA